jgi:hypothetical protein
MSVRPTKKRASVGGNVQFSSVLQRRRKLAGSGEAFFCLDFWLLFIKKK